MANKKNQKKTPSGKRKPVRAKKITNGPVDLVKFTDNKVDSMANQIPEIVVDDTLDPAQSITLPNHSIVCSVEESHSESAKGSTPDSKAFVEKNPNFGSSVATGCVEAGSTIAISNGIYHGLTNDLTKNVQVQVVPSTSNACTITTMQADKNDLPSDDHPPDEKLLEVVHDCAHDYSGDDLSSSKGAIDLCVMAIPCQDEVVDLDTMMKSVNEVHTVEHSATLAAKDYSKGQPTSESKGTGKATEDLRGNEVETQKLSVPFKQNVQPKAKSKGIRNATDEAKDDSNRENKHGSSSALKKWRAKPNAKSNGKGKVIEADSLLPVETGGSSKSLTKEKQKTPSKAATKTKAKANIENSAAKIRAKSKGKGKAVANPEESSEESESEGRVLRKLTTVRTSNKRKAARGKAKELAATKKARAAQEVWIDEMTQPRTCPSSDIAAVNTSPYPQSSPRWVSGACTQAILNMDGVPSTLGQQATPGYIQRQWISDISQPPYAGAGSVDLGSTNRWAPSTRFSADQPLATPGAPSAALPLGAQLIGGNLDPSELVPERLLDENGDGFFEHSNNPQIDISTVVAQSVINNNAQEESMRRYQERIANIQAGVSTPPVRCSNTAGLGRPRGSKNGYSKLKAAADQVVSEQRASGVMNFSDLRYKAESGRLQQGEQNPESDESQQLQISVPQSSVLPQMQRQFLPRPQPPSGYTPVKHGPIQQEPIRFNHPQLNGPPYPPMQPNIPSMSSHEQTTPIERSNQQWQPTMEDYLELQAQVYRQQQKLQQLGYATQYAQQTQRSQILQNQQQSQYPQTTQSPQQIHYSQRKQNSQQPQYPQRVHQFQQLQDPPHGDPSQLQARQSQQQSQQSHYSSQQNLYQAPQNPYQSQRLQQQTSYPQLSQHSQSTQSQKSNQPLQNHPQQLYPQQIQYSQHPHNVNQQNPYRQNPSQHSVYQQSQQLAEHYQQRQYPQRPQHFNQMQHYPQELFEQQVSSSRFSHNQQQELRYSRQISSRSITPPSEGVIDAYEVDTVNHVSEHGENLSRYGVSIHQNYNDNTEFIEGSHGMMWTASDIGMHLDNDLVDSSGASVQATQEHHDAQPSTIFSSGGGGGGDASGAEC